MFLFILLFSISSLLNPTFCQEGEASNAYLIRANSNTCPKGVPERILQGINPLGFSKETTAHSQLFTSQHLSHASWSLPEFGSFGRAAWLTSISPVPVNQQHKVEVNLAGAIDSLVAQCPPGDDGHRAEVHRGGVGVHEDDGRRLFQLDEAGGPAERPLGGGLSWW
ncbi:hypothetical protein TYRP_001581 [Tyrophagus putrescentiae]|nr:hypothetical protein TYRP_001581 [Tyrophagus putrescentiae]